MTENYSADWQDLEAVKKLTGQFVNRIFVQHMGDGMLRLNFGEVLDADDPTYHTALVISAANAMSFAELIYGMAQQAIAPPPSFKPTAETPSGE